MFGCSTSSPSSGTIYLTHIVIKIERSDILESNADGTILIIDKCD
jgi:hypothetical protein